MGEFLLTLKGGLPRRLKGCATRDHYAPPPPPFATLFSADSPRRMVFLLFVDRRATAFHLGPAPVM